MNAPGSSSSAWPTAQSWDGKGANQDELIDWGNARPLNEVAVIWARKNRWPTPDAFVSNDAEQPETFLARREREKAKGQNGNGMGTPLAMAVKIWNTPTVGDVTGGHASRSGDRSSELLLNGQARALSDSLLPDPTSSSDGAPSSASGKTSLQLNPAFVAWLMGWTTPARTNSGFWEMGSIPYRARMRFELLRIGLPPAAPPQQLSLFA